MKSRQAPCQKCSQLRNKTKFHQIKKFHVLPKVLKCLIADLQMMD